MLVKKKSVISADFFFLELPFLRNFFRDVRDAMRV